MDTLLQDVRYALRGLARAPGVTLIALLTIALGTGANATVFSFVSALLLRPVPGVVDPGTVVSVFTSDFSSGPYGDSSYPDFESLRVDISAFSLMAAEKNDSVGVVRVGDLVERVRMSAVTGDYFDLLGLEPVIGRLIAPADTARGAAPAAVISHALWMRRFNADPAVLGSALTVNGSVLTIVGVAPRAFQGLSLGRATELWTPFQPPESTQDSRGDRSLAVIARLRPGATLDEARAQVAATAARLAREYPDTNMGTLTAPSAPRPMTALVHTRIGPEFRGMVATLGAVLMAAVALVLLIACTNVAGLLLSRATARSREIAIRLALGASRQRIVRQLLTESLLLGLSGGVVGLLFSLWTADLLPSFFPADVASTLDASIDLLAFAFIVLLSLLASLAFGLAPAFSAARASNAASLGGSRGSISDARSGNRLRRVLVAAQMAVAVVLLTAAALLVQSLQNALNADPGFGTRDGVVASVDLPEAEFTSVAGLQYYRAVRERIRTMPGVIDAAFVRTLPRNRGSRRGFRIDGYEPRPGEDTELFINILGEGYIETMQMRMVAGRAFDRRDGADGARVALVNDAFASRYFRGQAVGRRITDSQGTAMEIVGVVRAVENLTPQDPAVPTVYYPLEQSYASHMSLVVRTAGDGRDYVDQVRREAQGVIRTVPVFRVLTLASHLAEAVADTRLAAVLVAVCGAIALLLATIGVYGVLAYAVIRRTREIGVRIALGARSGDVVRLVLGEGFAVAVVGIGLGLGAAALAVRALAAATTLYGVSQADPLTFVAVPASLAGVALLAAVIPMRRALRVDPNMVLRQE